MLERVIVGMRAYTDGSIIRNARVVRVYTKVSGMRQQTLPLVNEGMTSADIWRIINVGV
jgi:hypothetical protein